MDAQRAIIHLDLDAFYASVEVLDDPTLRGQPVIVGGDGRRGVVCAASYEARKFGVRSAMPTSQARRLCPGAVFLPPRFGRYQVLSEQVMDIFARYTPLVEPLSLDEAFLDVTASRALFGGGREIAREIKERVRSEAGLPVSAGIAEVKFAAKIATDLGKPDGLVEVPRGQVRAFLDPLPVSRLWGVGKVTEAALVAHGITTIGDIARCSEAFLVEAFGEHGAHLKALSMGEDPRDVVPDGEARSLGSEDTFEWDVTGLDQISLRLLPQAWRVARRLRLAGLAGRTVTVKLKYADFELITRRTTLEAPTDDARTIHRAACAQLERAAVDRPIRLTGISVSGFSAAPSPRQMELFPPAPDPTLEKQRALNATLDAIAARFGERAVVPLATRALDELPVRGPPPRSKKT